MIARALLAAVALLGAEAHATPDALVGSEWRVERLGALPIAPRLGPTIRFERDFAAGFSGCNAWRSRARGEDTALAFDAIVVAKRKCGDGVKVMEEDFLRALARTQRARRIGPRLVLIDFQGRETMRLTR